MGVEQKTLIDGRVGWPNPKSSIPSTGVTPDSGVTSDGFFKIKSMLFSIK